MFTHRLYKCGLGFLQTEYRWRLGEFSLHVQSWRDIETLITATFCVCGWRSMHACTYLCSNILQAPFHLVLGAKRTIGFLNKLPRRDGFYDECLLAVCAGHVQMLILHPPDKLQGQHNYTLAEFPLNIHYKPHFVNPAGARAAGAQSRCPSVCYR